jgi:tRNA-dihydrouridine synthase B
MKIGPIELESPFVVSPMAGMTDTAFRRLVKRQGGCGLVVSEMVSSEGLVRGIDRTLEYAEYTEEERPVSIQIFGGEPAKMAEAARVVEQMGANIVDVNMGCPVPKIAKHNAGCSLMREPAHAAAIIAAMSRAVKIPVTVKMRKGWDDGEVNAGELAKRVEDAGAKAIAIHGRTAKQSYSGFADWDFVTEVARTVSIPVFGSGDCIEPEDIVTRMKSGVSGVYVGRGVLRNPWILTQARDLMEGRPARAITHEERGQFLLDYMNLLLIESVDEAAGFRHSAGSSGPQDLKTPGPLNQREAVGRERWVINKIRALCSWYTKGFDGGAQFRIGVNSAKSITELQDLIERFFLLTPVASGFSRTTR